MCNTWQDIKTLRHYSEKIHKIQEFTLILLIDKYVQSVIMINKAQECNSESLDLVNIDDYYKSQENEEITIL